MKSYPRYSVRVPLEAPVEAPVSGERGDTHVEVAASYSKGGINYFTYNTDPEGYTLSISPIRVEESGAVSFWITGRTKDQGVRFLLKPATRFNRKTLDEFWRVIRPRVEELAKTWAETYRKGETAPLRQYVEALKVAA